MSGKSEERLVQRFVLIALVAVWPILSLVNQALSIAHPFYTEYGGAILVNIGRQPPYDSIIAEAPDAPGWRKGDRFSAASLSFGDRLRLYGYEQAHLGDHLDVTVLRSGRAVRLHLPVEAVPIETVYPNYRLAEAAGLIEVLIVFFVPLALVCLRPSPVTWAYYLSGSMSAVGGLDQMLLPGAIEFTLVTLGYALQSIGLIFLAEFAARFPDGRILISGRRIVTMVALIALVIAVLEAARNSAGVLYAIDTAPNFLISDDANTIANLIQSGGTALAYSLCFIALGLHYRVLEPADRAKIRWVVFAAALYVANAVASILVRHFVPFHHGWRTSDVILFFTGFVTTLFLQGAIVYTVLRHRVFDVRFALNRALAYVLLTGAFVLLLELVDIYVSHQLVESKIATIVEILVALAFAFGLDTAKQQIERFLGATFFRSRERALDELRKLTKSVRVARHPETVSAMLTLEVAEALHLTSAAVFRIQGDVFRRLNAVEWQDETATEIEGDALLALELSSSREPMPMHAPLRRNLALPSAELQPVLAVPLITGNRLDGFALFGAHRDGDDLDPDEVKALHALVETAAVAYEHLETEALRVEVVALRAQLHPVG